VTAFDALSERFRIERPLGAGGFGIVYEATDLLRNHRVALKVIRAATPESLYRFKREFRSLADIAHPNLVQLYELFGQDGGEWFFTMELLHGTNLLEHVWDAPAPRTPTPDDRTTLILDSDLVGGAPSAARSPRASPANMVRLRETFRQVTGALCSLHAAGKLHRDIKPSNVIVTRDAQVKVLDFGLVADLAPHDAASAHIAGTPAYMSPEQIDGRALGPATDWYSVGVMLYQALTGTAPFTSGYYKMAAEKQAGHAALPDSLVTGIPKDLNSLCMELLKPAPEQRPDGTAILGRLSGVSAITVASRGVERPAGRLVGRDESLAQLRQSFEQTRAGRTVVCLVEGTSGIGKTALTRQFLGELRQAGDVVVLTGRCYQRESVPYKAIDSVIDDLARYLTGLSPLETEALMPRDAPTLAKIFPVLRRVENVVSERRRHLEVPDAHELRRRAFGALREMLTRLADLRPVAIFVDDLQWGDADSADLLEEVLREPDPPPILFLGCYRAEEATTSAFVQRLSTGIASERLQRITLGELDAGDAATLARLALGDESADDETVEHIVRESAGVPLFLDQFARHMHRTDDRRGRAGASFADMIALRVADVSPTARCIIAAAAINGRPLPFRALKDAFALDADAENALAQLRADNLIRIRESSGDVEVEPYHDRIRETVAAAMPRDEIQMYHLRLGLALERMESADAELLATHFAAGGDPERAGRYALTGATEAHDALAFDRAARLYTMALGLTSLADDERQSILRRKGDAFSGGGRGEEAARAYLAAAELRGSHDLLELKRRATEQFLVSGHLDEGRRLLAELLEKHGMSQPRTPVGTLASLLWHRLRLRLRGFDFTSVAEAQVPRSQLVRVDTCSTVAFGLGMSDTLRGALFQTRNLLMALSLGEPYRISKALAFETAFQTVKGVQAVARVDRLATRARALAQQIGHPHALALVELFDSIIGWSRFEFRPSVQHAKRSNQMLRERCTGVSWELTTSRIFELASLLWLGEWAEYARRFRGAVEEAAQRGDLYASISIPLLSYSYSMFLAADDPNGAREHLRGALTRWTPRGFHLQHFWARYGEVETDLYVNRGPDAYARVLASEGRVRWSLLLEVQVIRIVNRYLSGRAALAAAWHHEPALVRQALAQARALEREGVGAAKAMAHALRAGVDVQRGRTNDAIVHLVKAEEEFAAVEMHMFRQASKYCRAVLQGEPGGQTADDARGAIAAEGVRNPAALAAMLVPALRPRL